MKQSQLRAIWYAEREKRYRRVEEAGLMEGFKKSKYKYLACYLKSIGRFDL